MSKNLTKKEQQLLAQLLEKMNVDNEHDEVPNMDRYDFDKVNYRTSYKDKFGNNYLYFTFKDKEDYKTLLKAVRSLENYCDSERDALVISNALKLLEENRQYNNNQNLTTKLWVKHALRLLPMVISAFANTLGYELPMNCADLPQEQ